MADETDRIRDDISGLRSMIDSMNKSVTSNMSEVLQRLTSLERVMEGHVELDDSRHKGQGDTLEKHGDTIDELEKERQQRKGILWLLGFAGVGEILHLIGSIVGK